MGQINCNKCGRELHLGEGIHKDDCLKVVKEWGYFSKKDRERHTFYICETCYDELTAGFIYPVQIEPVEEML